MARWIFRVVVLLLILYGLAEYNRRRAQQGALRGSEAAAIPPGGGAGSARSATTRATPASPAAPAGPARIATAPQPVARSGAASPQGDSCPTGYPIKGNLSSGGEKIYHTTASRTYAVTKPEACFATEQDALDAGYRKALDEV